MKKTRVKNWAGVICLLAGLMLVSGQKASAGSKEVLLQHIKARTSEPVQKTYYADFDGDGKAELFAVTGKKEAEHNVWYSGAKKTALVYKDGMSVYGGSPGICKVSAHQKLLVLEAGGYGSSSMSLCYYVKNGKPVRVKYAGEGLCQLSGKEFAVHMTAFDACSDGSGHTWKAYYLRWTGSKFTEYIGKKISLKTLKSYTGANAYLKQIQKLGYQIGTIYYRKNGIINVNLRQKAYGKVYANDNVTFRLSKRKVTLVVHDKGGTNLVEKSGYGGKYRAKGF